MTNLLLIMTVIYLSCLFNHAVLWIEQSLWERRRLPGVKLVCWHRSRGCAVRSRLIAFAPYGLNKLRFIRVSRKEEFPETSHFPSSVSNLFLSLTYHLVWLCWPTRGGLAWALSAAQRGARRARPPLGPGPSLHSLQRSLWSTVQRFCRTRPSVASDLLPTFH